MMASRSEVWLTSRGQADLDWLVAQGVSTAAMTWPTPMMVTTGEKASDGLLEHAEDGPRWFAFEQTEDFIFWHPPSGALATYCNRAFALGEEMIDQATTYAFDCNLNIFADPVEWLRAKRDGIVVLPNKWPLAFDRLRDAPRIAIAEQLLPLYRRHMKPHRMPELMIIPERRHVA